MAKSGKAAKAAGAYGAVRTNQYVKRLMEDDELRDNLRTAFESSRSAYGRVSNGKGPSKLLDDKKVHRDLRAAAESLREASDQLRGKRQRKGLTFGRLLMLTIVGAALAIALSEDIRKAVLDRLFGAEEEFEYSSTTSPAPQTESSASSA